MIFKFYVLILCISCQLFFGNSQNCKNPLLSQSYNSWAPFPNITLKTATKSDSLKICSYLSNEIACCDSTILDTYNITWGLFKDYFNKENKNQLKILAAKIENAYLNRKDIVSVYKNMNSSLNSIYSQLDDIRNQNQDLNIQLQRAFNSSQFNFNNISDFFNTSLKINIDQLDQIYLNNSLNWNLNISDLLLQNTSGYYQQDYLRYLDNLDEERINQEINNTRTRFSELVNERTKCFSAVFRHFASLMCLSCENDYQSNGIFVQNKKIHLNLSIDTCASLEMDCYGYIEKSVEMNKNALFFSNIDSLLSWNISNSNYSSVSELYNFLKERQTSLTNFLNQQILFVYPKNCTTGNCPWICLEYITSNGLNFELILNGTTLKTDALNSFNLNLNNRVLVSNNEFINSTSVNFNKSFKTNTYTKADSTNLNFSIDGSAGFVLFERNKNETIQNISNFMKRICFEILVFWLLIKIEN